MQSLIDQMICQDDLVAHYESRLPAPLNVPLNVVKVEPDESLNQAVKVSLLHPHLKAEEQLSNFARVG